MSETVPKDAKANGTKIVAKRAKANGIISWPHLWRVLRRVR